MKYATLVSAVALGAVVTSAAAQSNETALRRRALWQAGIAPSTSDSGALVLRVTTGSAVARAGLRAGDRIVTLGLDTLSSADRFWAAYGRLRGGDTVRARIRRQIDGAAQTLELQFVLDAVPPEILPGVNTSYEAVHTTRGFRVRTVVTRPAASRNARLPAILVIPWLSCDPVEKPEPGTDGMSHVLRDIATRSGMLMMRVEKPGVGDSEGPLCRDAILEDDLAAFRAALAALRARSDVDSTRIVLLGMSVGGALAPILAAESPSGITGVVSVGGFTRTWYEHMLDIERRRLTLSGVPPTAVNAAMQQFARFYTEYLIGLQTPEQVLQSFPPMRPLWYDEPRHQYGRPAAYYHAVQRLDVEGAWAALARRGIPVLIVWGEYDWIMGRAEAERAAEIVNSVRPGRASLSIVPKADHGLMVFASPTAAFNDENPRYNGLPGRMVNDWLRKLSATITR